MTKKARALQIFVSMDGQSRQQIIDRFISDLDMTPAGAATYYANCKKEMAPKTTMPFMGSVPETLNRVSILDQVPTWKQNMLDKHNEVIKKAEQLYDVDLSEVGVRFDLRGRAAGMACRRGSEYYVRYNVEACQKYFDEMANDTIPHEIAHIVCMKRPHLGKNHDRGWKRVCRSLGGDDSRCHNMELTVKRKTRYRFIYEVAGEEVLVGPKHHKKIQEGYIGYTVKSSRMPIRAHHFIRKITI